MTTLTINELKKEFSKNLTKVPKFMAPDILHDVLWRAMLECNQILLRLVVDKFLTPRRIELIKDDFNDYLEAIIDNTPPNIHLHLSAYYIVVIEEMIKRSNDEEHYEVCSNLKKFSDYYFTNTTPDIND